MNLPNKLTIFRVILIPFFVFFLLTDVLGANGDYLALVIFIVASLTDMLDGPLARKTGTESRIGEVLDSAADLIFAAVSLVRLLPVYKEEMPFWLWAAVAFVIYLKGKNAIAGYVMNGKIVTMHTPLNRLAGLALFALPLVCIWVPLTVYGGFCAAAAVAATVDAFIRMLRNSTKPDTAA